MITFCVQRELLLRQVEERGKSNDEPKKTQQKMCKPQHLPCYCYHYFKPDGTK